MDKKWRNLLLVLALLAVALLAAYFLFFQNDTFGQGVLQIGSFWQAESINPANLTPDKIQLINEDAISRVQVKLASFRQAVPDTDAGRALSRLADVHMAVADVILANKALSEKVSQADSIPAEQLCGNIAVFEQVNSLTRSLAEKTKAKNESARQFISDYANAGLISASYAQESGVAALVSDETGLDAAVQSSDEGLQELKDSCGGVQ